MQFSRNQSRCRSGRTVLAIAALVGSLLSEPHLAMSETISCLNSFNFRLEHPGPWPVTGELSSGETCANRTWWSRGTLKRLYVSKFPKNGTLKLQEGAKWFYTPRAGFAGSDSFGLKVCGALDGKDYCTFLTVDLTVRPR